MRKKLNRYEYIKETPKEQYQAELEVFYNDDERTQIAIDKYIKQRYRDYSNKFREWREGFNKMSPDKKVAWVICRAFTTTKWSKEKGKYVTKEKTDDKMIEIGGQQFFKNEKGGVMYTNEPDSSEIKTPT